VTMHIWIYARRSRKALILCTVKATRELIVA
jgi:hypothetical protein